jgi:hypothetical protein
MSEYILISKQDQLKKIYFCDRQTLEERVKAFNAVGGFAVSKQYYTLQSSFLSLRTTYAGEFYYFMANKESQLIEKNADEELKEGYRIFAFSCAIKNIYDQLKKATKDFESKVFYSDAEFYYSSLKSKTAHLGEGEFKPIRILLGGILAEYSRMANKFKTN